MRTTTGTLLPSQSSSSSWGSTCLGNSVSSRCTRNLESLMNNIFRAFTCRHGLHRADPPPPFSSCPTRISLALPVRIAKRFSVSTCIHVVSSRRRRCSPDDKNGLFLSCRPIPPPPLGDRRFLCLVLLLRCPSFVSSTARLPRDLTNRLIRSSSQIPLFVHPARRDTTRCP